MNKYIKLDDAIKGLNIGYGKYDYVSKVAEYYYDLPTIDIVRCKECKHCREEEIEETMPIYIYCDLVKSETELDSFCSYGERIESKKGDEE